MTTVLLMHGYIGFGKTTIAKKFEEMGYIRYTHDEFMSKIYGDDPSNEDFEANYNTVKDLILDLAYANVKQGKSVILDFGFWTADSRLEIMNILSKWSGIFSIIWCNIICDLTTARNRCINRDNARSDGTLKVPVDIFDMKVDKFQPMSIWKDYSNITLTIDTNDH